MFTKFVYLLDKLIHFNETSREPASLPVLVQPTFLVNQALRRSSLLLTFLVSNPSPVTLTPQEVVFAVTLSYGFR